MRWNIRERVPKGVNFRVPGVPYCPYCGEIETINNWTFQSNLVHTVGAVKSAWIPHLGEDVIARA